MQLGATPIWAAPQSTGHPAGLPAPIEPGQKLPTVKPIADRSDPDSATAEGKPPLQFWRTAGGEPDPSDHTAPPSIMQIKISQMLDRQADASTEDAPPSNPGARSMSRDPGADCNASADTSAADKNEEQEPATPPDIAKVGATQCRWAAYEDAAQLGHDPIYEAIA